jgi:hypothetical protein
MMTSSTIEYKGNKFEVFDKVQPRMTVWGNVYKVWAKNLVTGLSGYLLEVLDNGEVFRTL